MKNIKIQAPATVANLSCGFDILGLCLDKPFDEIEVDKINEKKVVIELAESKYSNIPTDPRKNTGGLPAIRIIEDLKLNFGFKIKIKKGIPLCGGMGSSASTASGVVFAINKILNETLTDKEMLKYALIGESVSVKNPHADNIAPCLFGGLTIIRDTKTLDIININVPDLYVCLIHPDISVSTQDARDMLPNKIKLASAVKQWGNIAALVTGFANGDFELIKRSMQDEIIEPVRAPLISGFYDIKNKSIDLGALGCGISGSGPTIFAICESKIIAKKIMDFSKNFYRTCGIDCDVYISKVNHTGPKVIK